MKKKKQIIIQLPIIAEILIMIPFFSTKKKQKNNHPQLKNLKYLHWGGIVVFSSFVDIKMRLSMCNQ